IAYTQCGVLPLMQVSAFTGVWGVSFLIAWTASTFEWMWSRRFQWSAVRGPVLACCIALGVVLVAGAFRVILAQAERSSRRAATLNRPVDLFAPGEMTRIEQGKTRPEDQIWVADKMARLQDWFLEDSRREARAGARVIVWPEANLLVLAEDEANF